MPDHIMTRTVGLYDRESAAAIVKEFAAHVVCHPRFDVGMSLIADFAACGVVNGQASCMLLTGPSGVGKSELVRQHLKQAGAGKGGGDAASPDISLQMPAEVTLKSLAEALLTECGDPAPHRGGLVEKMWRVKRFLHDLGRPKIVLDEAQHLTGRGTDRRLLAVANWLKQLLNEGGSPILLVGTDEARQVLRRDQQLARRCFACFRLRPFDWDDPAEQAEFLQLAGIFNDMLPTPERETLLGERMGHKLHLASLGRLGRLALLLQKALFKALMEGGNSVEERHLWMAYEEWAVLQEEGEPPPPNPFLKEGA